MDIPLDILYERRFEVSEDTDLELIDAVKDYNVNMGDCKARMKDIEKIRRAFILLNGGMIAVFALLLLLTTTGLSWKYLMVLIYGMGFLVFGVRGYKPLISSVFSLCLVPIHLVGIAVALMNIALGVYYANMLSQVTDQPDFPKFREISIIYQQHSRTRAQRAETGEAKIEDLCDSRDARVREDAEPKPVSEHIGMMDI